MRMMTLSGCVATEVACHTKRPWMGIQSNNILGLLQIHRYDMKPIFYNGVAVAKPEQNLLAMCSVKRSSRGDMRTGVRTSKIVADGKGGIPSASVKICKPWSTL